MKLLLLCLVCVLIQSCQNFRAGLYLISIDEKNGQDFIHNEPKVKEFIEDVIISYEEYTIKAFARTPIHFQFKRSKLMTHTFYVIIHKDGAFHTLSFYGTDFNFRSRGVWTLNSDSDVSSYTMYLENNNRWDVEEIFIEKDNDVIKTLQNINTRIDTGTNFYYRDHRKDKPNANNCITALYETIVFKK